MLKFYNVIENEKICYLDKIVNSRRDCPFDKISGIEDSIIVINEKKLKINYDDELDNLKRIMDQYKNKIFIFEDSNYCKDKADGELGELVSLLGYKMNYFLLLYYNFQSLILYFALI